MLDAIHKATAIERLDFIDQSRQKGLSTWKLTKDQAKRLGIVLVESCMNQQLQMQLHQILGLNAYRRKALCSGASFTACQNVLQISYTKFWNLP